MGALAAKALREWRGLPFEPPDIALTTGAFGALATAFRALLLIPATRVVYSLPPWFLYEPMLCRSMPCRCPLTPGIWTRSELPSGREPGR